MSKNQLLWLNVTRKCINRNWIFKCIAREYMKRITGMTYSVLYFILIQLFKKQLLTLKK